jgi:HEXXH motif-containing protein
MELSLAKDLSTRFEFDADPRHAAAMAASMARRLGGSLRHIVERSAGHVDVLAARTLPMIERLEAGERAAPDAFAVYHDMVRAIERDDLDDLQALFHDLADAGRPFDGMRVTGFSVDELGSRRIERYGRHAGDDADHPVRFATTRDGPVGEFGARVSAALKLLASGAPAVASEIEAVVSEVVVAEPNRSDGGRDYGSISAFPLWGAIFVNPAGVRDDIDCAAALVHETTHMLLFAHSVDEPLVFNPRAEVFDSPLREDQRPMDGILHATCVTARIHAALSTCIASRRLNAQDEDAALRRLGRLADSCARGLAVVRSHADLTDTGRAVVDAIERYMAGGATGVSR